MWYVDQIGLGQILTRVREFKEEHVFGWKAAPLLERLVFEGRSFRIVMPFDDARHSQSTTRRIIGPCGEVGERGIDFFDTPET